jgi:hypothetical protein
MHDFLGQENSSKMCFHDKPMLKHVTRPSSIGVIRSFHQRIAITVNESATIPSWVLLHTNIPRIGMLHKKGY